MFNSTWFQRKLIRDLEFYKPDYKQRCTDKVLPYLSGKEEHLDIACKYFLKIFVVFCINQDDSVCKRVKF